MNEWDLSFGNVYELTRFSATQMFDFTGASALTHTRPQTQCCKNDAFFWVFFPPFPVLRPGRHVEMTVRLFQQRHPCFFPRVGGTHDPLSQNLHPVCCAPQSKAPALKTGFYSWLQGSLTLPGGPVMPA